MEILAKLLTEPKRAYMPVSSISWIQLNDVPLRSPLTVTGVHVSKALRVWTS